MPAILKAKKPRIVNLSSIAQQWATDVITNIHKINDPSFLDDKGRYGHSKLANMLFTRGLDKRYGAFVTVNSCHPGVVATELDREMSHRKFSFLAGVADIIKTHLLLTPAQGALSSIFAATSPEIDKMGYHGCYFVPYAQLSTKVNPLSLSEALSDQLWEFTDALVNEKLNIK